MLAAALAAPPVQAQQASADAQTVQILFRYGQTVDTYVPARYDGRHFYLSLSGVFDPLKIDLEIDPEAQVASGFYLQPERTYRIDFAKGTAQIGQKQHAVADSSFQATELGFYVHPSLLEKLFGLRFEVNMRRVALTLNTSDTMPVEEARERATQRLGARAAMPGTREYAPLLYDRRFHWLRGGVLGYALGASASSRTGDSYRFTLGGGGELAGGDFEGTLRGSASRRGDLNLDLRDVRWRYVPERNPYLREVRVGALRSTGLRSRTFYGVHLSNEPVRFQRQFGTRLVQGQTRPGWEVELYVNDRLAGYTEADELGNYSFEVPLTYGSTYMTVKIYGPSGQFEKRRRRLQVPFTFVPEGRVQYGADLGRTTARFGRDAYPLGQAYAAVGLTSWLTNRAGVEYLGVGDSLRAGASPWRFYDRVSLRFADHYLASVEVAPSVSYQASLEATLPWRASFGAAYTRFAEDAAANPFGRQRDRLRLRGSLPLERWGVPAYLRLSTTQTRTDDGRAVYRLRPSLSVQPFSGARAQIGYRAALNDPPGGPYRFQQSRVTSRLTYSVPRSVERVPLLGGTLLSASLNYDEQRRSLGNVSFEASRRLFRYGRVRLSYGRNVALGTNRVRARLTFNLPYARSTTSAFASGTGSGVSQSVSGAVGYDDRHGRVAFDDQSWVGGSAASVRFFIDGNGNDQYDEGERVIKNGRVRFGRSAATHTSERGVTRAYDLRAYSRYNLDVRERTIRNPLWVPKADRFSFIAEPNAFTSIDVPFYVGGVVEGTVLRQKQGERSPVPGLRLHLRSRDGSYEKALTAFSDGAFYEMGVPPGTYELRVDSSQLAALGAVSDPPARRFEVEVTKRGDFVESLNFMLHPREDRETGSPPPGKTAKLPKNDAPPPARDRGEKNSPAPASSCEGPSARHYTVERGDWLSTISHEMYGVAEFWPKLWLANRDQLADPDRIVPRQRLCIPPKAPLTKEETQALRSQRRARSG